MMKMILCPFVLVARKYTIVINSKSFLPAIQLQCTSHQQFRHCSVSNAAKISKLDLKSLLKKQFSYDEKEVTKILKHPSLKEKDADNVADALVFLTNINVSAKDIERYPWILFLSRTELKLKMEILKSAGMEGAAFLPFLELPTENLSNRIVRARVVFPGMSKRLEYLCQELQLSMEEVVSKVARYPTILTMNFQKLQDTINLLKEAGLRGKDVGLISDVWIFKSNQDVLAKRINRLRKANAPFKTWILGTTDDVFDAHMNKWEKRTTVFGSKRDHVDYLAERLGQSREYVQRVFVAKNPRILTINPPKLKEMLDLLFSNGYKPEDICAQLTVLSRCVETIKQRIYYLKSLGIILPYLKVLRTSVENYEKAVCKLILEIERREKMASDGSTLEAKRCDKLAIDGSTLEAKRRGKRAVDGSSTN